MRASNNNELLLMYMAYYNMLWESMYLITNDNWYIYIYVYVTYSTIILNCR